VRAMIKGPVPAYQVAKTTHGEGGSLLLSGPSIVFTGESIVPQSMPKDGDEMKKSLVATLRYGPASILFDNLNLHIDNGDLAAAQTSQWYAGRLLGHSELIKSRVWGSFIDTGAGTT